MLRRIVWLIPIFLMAGYAFWGLVWTDYQRGYKQAVRDARQAEQEMGWAVGVGGELLTRRSRNPPDEAPNYSRQPAPANFRQPEPDSGMPQNWQQGYRQALQDYLRQRLR